ncbi:MAG TPA: class E sortase [Streptosporangiaceae bacterium]|nr:class E sortase [Streptosporangiaceae bacterium]
MTVLTRQPVGAAGDGTSVPRGSLVVRCVGASLLLLGLLTGGFLAYLFGASRVQEAAAQSRLYSTFAGELGQDLGPLGPTGLGQPVAILDIPSIGLHNVIVVEGTTSAQLDLGPGHLRNTPLPGQLGLSVIYGRRATFGAPFARLDELRPGEEITAYTQQGKSVYKVVAVGDSQHPVTDTNLNRLALLTSSSAAIPAYYLEIDADLMTPAHNGPVQMPAIGPAEQAMAGDSGALVLTMLWGLALVLTGLAGAVAAARWSGWPVYLVIVPAVLAILWNLYESLAGLLPNLY